MILTAEEAEEALLASSHLNETPINTVFDFKMTIDAPI